MHFSKKYIYIYKYTQYQMQKPLNEVHAASKDYRGLVKHNNHGMM